MTADNVTPEDKVGLEKAKTDTPATGDDSNIGLRAVTMCVSILGLVILLLENKRRRSAR